MAYKEVTSGLTDNNAVLDEILDFVQNDLDVPWTLESNKNPTHADVSPLTSTTSSRNTWISIEPSQPNGIAHKGILSPDPTRIYIGLRNVTTGLQMHGTGFHDAAVSPLGDWWGEQGDFLEYRPVNNDDNDTNVFPPQTIFEGAGPFTKLYLFGPDNPGSPIDHTIPHYVMFVLEFEPGRYSHGFFGEYKKFVNFEGGWGCSGHDHGTSDPISTSNNAMWSDRRSVTNSEPFSMIMAANVGQVNYAGAGGPTRWYRHMTSTKLAGIEDITIPNGMRIFGHHHHKDFMTVTSQAVLSGFFPLVAPYICLLDSDSTVSKENTDGEQVRMPAAFMEDFFLGDITNFTPGVTVSIGGIDVVPFPITSKLATGLNTLWGGYFYRKRV